MKKMKKILAVCVCMVLIVGMLSGCGNKSKSESIDTVKSFLDAAKDKDYEKAGEYATDEAMENLGWDEMDSDTLSDVFYSSMGLTDEEVEELKKDADVTDAVNELVDKMSCDIMDYELVESDYEEDGDTAKVKVTVTRISATQMSEIFADLQTEINEKAAEIGDELTDTSDDSDDEDDTDDDLDDDDDSSDATMRLAVIKRLIPAIVPSMIESYDAAEGETENWIVQVDVAADKVSGVYEAE